MYCRLYRVEVPQSSLEPSGALESPWIPGGYSSCRRDRSRESQPLLLFSPFQLLLSTSVQCSAISISDSEMSPQNGNNAEIEEYVGSLGGSVRQFGTSWK